jgi:hypothetical protein
MKSALLLLPLLLSCGDDSLLNQVCETAGETVCEGNTQLRCATVWRKQADCAAECVLANPKNPNAGGTVHDAGDLGASETWTCEGSPHVVTGNVNVGASTTLTINPGALLRLDPTGQIVVKKEGKLVAGKLDDAFVLVTSNNGNKGGFGRAQSGGIDFSAPTDVERQSVLKNVIIERGVHGISIGNISPTSQNPIIEGTTLRDNERSGILLACDAGTAAPDYVTRNQFIGNESNVDASDCE